MNHDLNGWAGLRLDDFDRNDTLPGDPPPTESGTVHY